MRPAPDDEFRLRFPVAKDRTLRRIAIVQMTIGMTFLFSLLTLFVSCSTSMYIENGVRKYGVFNVADAIMLLSLAILILTLPAGWIVSIIEGVIFTRRYGWRAIKDPIEAQRIAMREALYDVAMGSAQAMPDHDDDRLIVVPTRRLRPVQARLELTAEREKERARRET